MKNQLVALSLCLGLFVACGDPELEDEADALEASSAAATPGLSFTEVPFSPAGSVGTTETRVLIKTAAQFRAVTGATASSVGLDFSRSWAVFYAAGARRTGGFTASVEKIQLSSTGKTLTVTTALSSPGPDCLVTQALTKPVSLVKFAKPRTTTAASRFLKHDTTRSCGSTNCATTKCPGDTYCDDITGHAVCHPLPSCDTVRCSAGDHCELHDVQCIRAPCPPQPQCVPDALPPCATMRCMAGTYCGEPTPGQGACIPYSTCMNVRCTSGTHCEDRPIVCAKAPCPPTAPSCVAN
jgi:hypothetical protein